MDSVAATIITSNKAFSDWGHVFAGDAVMASAALDRLLHRATVINIKGDSYRMKEKRLTGLFPGTVALPDLHTIGACTGRMIAMASAFFFWVCN